MMKALLLDFFYWELFSGPYLVSGIQNILGLMETQKHSELTRSSINLILRTRSKKRKEIFFELPRAYAFGNSFVHFLSKLTHSFNSFSEYARPYCFSTSSGTPFH